MFTFPIMEFSGCYILRSQNPQYKNSCYIGFTVDPPHRLKQHNGEILGGAHKTHSKRPWEMTLVVWGFPTRKLALRFEWCWQHPTEAKRMKNVNWDEIFKSHGGPNKYQAKLRVLKEMLSSRAWARLSLRICVQYDDVYDDLKSPPFIPDNIRIEKGRIEDLPIKGTVAPTPGKKIPVFCILCQHSRNPPPEPANWVVCPFCGLFLHLRCVANQFIKMSPSYGSALIPLRGFCPSCKESLLWRDLVELRNEFPNEEAKETLEILQGESTIDSASF